MAKRLIPLVRVGGFLASKKYTPLVRNGGYTTQHPKQQNEEDKNQTEEVTEEASKPQRKTY